MNEQNSNSRSQRPWNRRIEQRIVPLDQSLRELASLGSPVDFDVAAEQSRFDQIRIEQSGASTIFELESGRIAYGLQVFVVNRTSRCIYIDEVDLELPWKDSFLQWLTATELTVPGHRGGAPLRRFQHYRFPGKNTYEFEADTVINSTLIEKRKLSPGRPIEGWLLGIGGAMRSELFSGGAIEATLVIATGDEHEYRADIVCGTERLEKRKARGTPKGKLFDEYLGGNVQPKQNDAETTGNRSERREQLENHGANKSARW